MNIPDILIHPTVEARLETFLEAPVHAILLAGPRGIGKTHIAVALASSLLTTTTLENQAYYREISPEKSTISIEQIRELIGFFRLKVPGHARIKRVAVIQDADSMGIEAQNALLKILEEPPTDSVLILTSSQPQKLLVTIRSRVQTLQATAPTTEALTQHFTSLGHEDSTIAAALLRAATNVAEATALLKRESSSNNDIVNLVKKALGGTTYDRLLIVDGLAKQKDLGIEFVTTLSAVATASLEAAARKGAASVSRWQSVVQAAHTAEDALLHSGNTKLVLTELMLSM